MEHGGQQSENGTPGTQESQAQPQPQLGPLATTNTQPLIAQQTADHIAAFHAIITIITICANAPPYSILSEPQFCYSIRKPFGYLLPHIDLVYCDHMRLQCVLATYRFIRGMRNSAVLYKLSDRQSSRLSGDSRSLALSV